VVKSWYVTSPREWGSTRSKEADADAELYLRRPPTANENYRLDRMLIAAAERGVKVNIIVYKEVSSILTRGLRSTWLLAEFQADES